MSLCLYMYPALRVNWMVFDIVSEDDQIVDLIATFGDPFPKARNILALKDYSDEDTVVNGNQHHSNRHHSDQLHSNRHHSDQLHSSRHHSYQHHNNQHQSNQHSNQHRHHSHQCHSNQHDSSQYDSGEDVEEMVVKNDDALSENDKIVSILIKQHEGQQTSVSPYSISQKKMVRSDLHCNCVTSMIMCYVAAHSSTWKGHYGSHLQTQ